MPAKALDTGDGATITTQVMRIEDTRRESAEARFLVAGELVLDRQDQRAWLSSTRLELGSKALALLEELMRQPGMLVTKDRLFEVGWPGQATSDAVLTTAIRELRRALGDAAREPEWVETQHGKGYRFLKPVTERAIHPGRQGEGEPADRGTGRIPKAVLGMAALLVVLLAAGWAYFAPLGGGRGEAEVPAAAEEQARVAVLPFSVENGEDWLGSAISSRVGDVLQNSPGLFVADAVMAQGIAGSDDVLAAARSEGLTTLVSGNVRLENGTLHVDVHVRDAGGQEIWSRRLSDDEGNLIALTERVAFEAARALAIASDPDTVAEMARIGTASLPAFEAYSRASQLLDSIDSYRNPDNMRSAIDNLERAVALDPTFAKASASLAWFTFPGPYSDDAEAAESKALTLLGMAARHASGDWDRRAAQAQLDMRMLRFAKARKSLEALYEETSRTSSDLNHSVLLMLRQIAAATQDRSLAGRVWRDMTEYNLARGRIQMSDPTIISHSPELLEQFAAYQAQQEPTPAGQYARHTALLLAGKTGDAGALLETGEADGATPYRMIMSVAQACANGEARAARDLARASISRADTSPYLKWKLAEVAGLGDLAARYAPKPASDAGQRALFGMLGEPGFDPGPYPLLARALSDAGAAATPRPRPAYYCPVA